MTTTTIGRRTLQRALATTTAAGVAAAGFALLPSAPAQAADGELTFAWEISQQFDDHLSTHTLAGGATEAEDGVVTFGGGEGSFDTESGATEVAYQGSVQGAFGFGGTTLYQVTIAEPVVTVDGDGNGQISAVVSASNAASGGNPAASTEPARVLVTTFDAEAADWAVADGIGSLTAVPHWDGVLPEGAESTALGITSGKPVGGRSFAPSFLGQITSGVRAHFYASAEDQPKKAPSPFVMTAAVAAEPTIEAGTSVSGNQLIVDISGSGFTAVTNPGDAGVYVGLAEAGGMPDTGSFEDQDAFAAADWIMPARMPEGSFTSSLTVARGKLDPRKDYAVYTWQAHAHSNTTQDTETAVEIDWRALGFPQKARAVAKVKAPTTKKAGKVSLTVNGGRLVPTGKVKVAYKSKGKKAWTRTRSLRKGQTAVMLPRSKKGKARLVVTYWGDDAFKRAVVKRTIRIKR
ncbi:HtaA domain-containing protein [Nocardioides sambongensis]|uniref:HtaA domain-containing protein n=1 Tax=Nocardioides sambongensis TaxID=2589074 RepID=UPI001128FDC8|nr:HtaA domain-containing protein [Nocardioides sambongensis]